VFTCVHPCLKRSLATAALLVAVSAAAGEWVHAKNGSGIYGYKATSMLQWRGGPVHLDREIYGETGLRILPANTRKLEHGPVRFRNLGIRPL
jgi:hypothetical protein